MTCNYRHGDKLCLETRHQSRSGIMSPKCKKHLAASNKNRRRRQIRKLENSDSNGAALRSFMDASRTKSRSRMQKHRVHRKAALDDIKEANVRRIAVLLDKIKSNKKYVIVPAAISAEIALADIELMGAEKPITFSDEGTPSKRTMQLIRNPQEILGDLWAAINAVFPACSEIEVKMLKSEAGDTQQLIHTDYAPEGIATPIRHLSGFLYSAVISLEKNTKLLVGECLKEIKIPMHSMIFFRGDMLHAGAAYSVPNCRLYLTASSESFPSSENVVLHFEK